MDNKCRILHVAQSAGGVDRYLRTLLKYLNHDKFEHVFVCSYDFRKEDYHELVIAFEQVEMQRGISSHDLNVISAVRRIIKKYKPDIVYAHSSKAGAVARAANIGFCNFCIYNPHGWAFNMHCSKKKQTIYTVIEKTAALFCKKIICISEAERRSAMDKKICKDKKLQVIINGVDIEEYDNQPDSEITRTALRIPETAFIVGMVGRMSPQKAPKVFIQAAKQIKKDIPEAFFIIVGNGEQEEDVIQYAKKNGLWDSLLITGWVDNPMGYADLFDVAMLLSRWEGFGLVLPEYMLAGKPIVASNVDAIPDIITDYVNGLLVKADDVEGAHKAVLKLYNNKELREQLILNGMEDVHNRFNAKRVAAEHEELFLNLLL